MNFFLPNGRLERVFSTLKFIKNNRRNYLKEEALDRLLRINIEVPALSKWNPETAVKLWSDDKVRRVTQKDKRKPRSKKDPQSASTSVSDEEPETGNFLLDEWVQWISDGLVEDNIPGSDLQEEADHDLPILL